MQQTRSTLKGYFLKGKIPTEEQFAALIDSSLNQLDDAVFQQGNNPLSIKAVGDEKGLLNFYRIEQGENILTWQLKQEAYMPGAKPGLSIHDADGPSRLFIEHGTGNVGIGTHGPQARLHVKGDGRIEGGLTVTGVLAAASTADVQGALNVGAATVQGSLKVNGDTVLAQEKWKTVTMLQPTLNAKFSYKYFMDSLGFVHLAGEIPSVGNVTKLPAKYRPAQDEVRCSVYAAGDKFNVLAVTVKKSGDIFYHTPDHVPHAIGIRLDGITFQAQKTLTPIR